MKSIFHTTKQRFGSILTLCTPQLSPTMTSGKIVKWFAKSGQYIKAYELICEISTGSLVKVKISDSIEDVLEIELQEDLYVGKILLEEGSNTNVGEPIAILCEDEDDIIKCQNLSPIESRNLNHALWQAYLKKPNKQKECN
jgi:pyruvate/2-oxoglutarate dehydrogenase complex dihydrolipoamide acyltransferase (E2) component